MILSAVGARSGRSFRADPPFCALANTRVFYPHSDCDRDFLWYVVSQGEFWVRGGSAQPYVQVASSLQRRIPFPPLPTQRAIAAYLDRETERIDTLIEKKERLLTLLEEKRTALITRAVTKGLDPDVPMKDSGVKWLGEVPAHWEVVPLRRAAQVIDCKHRTPEYVARGWPVVSTTEVKAGTLDLSLCRRFVSDNDFRDMREGARTPDPGDVVYSRNASLGVASLVHDTEFCLGQDVVLVRARSRAGRFWTHLLNSPPVTGQVASVGVGSTFSRINVATIRELLVPWPSDREQRAIGGSLDDAVEPIHQAASRITHAISLLKEYRSALISAAVTGQLEVPPLPGDAA